MNSKDTAVSSSAVPVTQADTIVASPSDARPPLVRHSQFPATIGRYRIIQVLGEVERAGARVVQLYTEWGKSQQASDWRRKLPRS
jgi:hypothetical protein